MSVKRTIILCPGHGLEDVPSQVAGDTAADFLSTWTAAWHPLAIAHVGAPSWRSADQLDFDREGSILLVSKAAQGWLTQDFLHDAKANGAHVVHGSVDRATVVAQLLTVLPDQTPIKNAIVDDFLAFGYWYLQTELLSYQLRYTSGLDRDVVAQPLSTAANAALESARTGGGLIGEDSTSAVTASLAEAYGILSDQRLHYYPVDSFLLDLTLVAKFNCGIELQHELADGHARNVWLTGETLEHMAEHQPQSLAQLRNAIEEGRAEPLGGDFVELPTSLVSRRELHDNLHDGRLAFEKHLGRAPTVYVRRRFGLSPTWPQLLRLNGYRGALHATFDEGAIPTRVNSRARWQGTGSAVIEACGATVLDASKPQTALSLGATMGQSMENDFVAALVLARWAGQRTAWLDDLERGQRFF